MNTERKQPIDDAVRLPATASGPELKTKLLRGIAQHYEGDPDAVRTAVMLPDDMQPVLIKIFDYILKTMGLEFLKVPLDDLTPKQLTARLLICKIDELGSIIAESPEVFNPIIACAISTGIDLVRLAGMDQSGQIIEILREYKLGVEQAAGRGASSAARKAVDAGFRRRDKKTRPNSDNIRTGQYDAKNWREAFEEVRRLMKEPGARIGEVLADVRKSKCMTKVTEDRFRRKWYEELKRTPKFRGVK